MHVLPVGDCDGGVVGGISDSFIVSTYVHRYVIYNGSFKFNYT